MLKLWKNDHVSVDDAAATRRFIGVLHEAKGVTVSRQLNGEYSLKFNYPRGGKFEDRLMESLIVECEGQLYVIVKISRSSDLMYSVSCTHVFNFYAHKAHIPNLASTDSGDFIGEDAYKVIKEAVNKCNPYMGIIGFHLMTADELAKAGLEPISLNIDFESIDKTNLYDAVQRVIECAGMGELYVDNLNFAVVKRIGADTNMTLSTAVNMTDISVERDISEIITQLFVYGKDDMTIEAASSNTDGKDYIVSDMRLGYGIISGYKDFPDYTDPDKLFERALWELDEENPDRIDVPSINISGTMIDLARCGKNAVRLNLGDSVRVVDGGENIYERVIELTRYPYEPEEDSVSIGRVKKDMFFYLNQLGTLSKRYKDTSTYNGKIQGGKISGTVCGSAVKVRGAKLTADSDGNLYLNGKKVITEG